MRTCGGQTDILRPKMLFEATGYPMISGPGDSGEDEFGRAWMVITVSYSRVGCQFKFFLHKDGTLWIKGCGLVP